MNDLTQIPRGWAARAWAQNLDRIADGCADHHAERATELRVAATVVLDRIGPIPPTCETCGVELHQGECRDCAFRRALASGRRIKGAA
jgi:hypothetical protein